MSRVHHVKSARKAIPGHGIKVGDSYYWWKLRRPGQRDGVKYVSKTPPKPSQLTQSEYLSAVYAIQEEVEAELDTLDNKEDVEAFASFLNDKASEVRDVASEQDDKFNNMPEGLQQGNTGQLLEQRRDACEGVADALESAASEIEGIEYSPDENDAADAKADNVEPDSEDAENAEHEHFVSEAQNIMGNVSWDWE